MTALSDLLRPVTRLLRSVRDERGLFVRSTLSMTAFQLATAAAAGLSTAIATAVVAGADSRVVLGGLIALAAAVALVATFTWVESWLSHVLAYRVIDALRMRVYGAVEQIVPEKSGERRSGDVGTTAMSDVESLEWFYAHTLGSGINALLSPLIVSVALVWLVGPIGLIVPLGIAALLAIPWLLAPVQVRQGAEIRAHLADLHAVAFEGAQARRELAALDLTAHHREQVLARTDGVQRAKRRFALRAAGESALAEVVVAATSLGFLVALWGAASRGDIPSEVVPAALVLVGAAVAPAAGAFAMMQRIGEISAAAGRVLGFIDLGAGNDELGQPVPHDGRGAISIQDLHFAYGTTPVLEGLTLTIEGGESVALVGSSGAGKTTIARLLTRLWRADSGHVVLDGARIDTLNAAELRREVALVSQHPFVFRGTIRSNLELAAPNATDERMWTALRDAGLAETVAAFPKGLDEPVGDRGSTLSGGQRQRLSIAQVLLRDPAVLILDEASAQLDPLRELDLSEAVARLRRGRTTIVIAHRASTIRRAARVIVIEHGRVIGDGTHSELLDSLPAYRRLLASEHADEPRPPEATAAGAAHSSEGR